MKIYAYFQHRWEMLSSRFYRVKSLIIEKLLAIRDRTLTRLSALERFIRSHGSLFPVINLSPRGAGLNDEPGKCKLKHTV